MTWTDAGLFYCAAVWGATFYLVKDALAGVDPVALVGYRFLISAACLLPWVLPKKNKAALLKEAGILAFFLVSLYLSQTVGLGLTTASNSGFITGLFILFVPLFMLLFFRQPPTLQQWAAVALAVAGLLLLTGGPRSFNRGDALTLVSAAAYAAHLLATDRFVKGTADTVLLAFHQFWMTGLACLALMGAAGLPYRVAGVRSGGVILFLAVFPTLSAFFMQMHAQRRTNPVKVSLIFSLEPAFAAVFAWTLGGEAFRPASAAGGGLIVAAMMLGELSKLAAPKGRKQEVLPV